MIKKASLLVLLLVFLAGCGLVSPKQTVSQNASGGEEVAGEAEMEAVETETMIPDEAEETFVLNEESEKDKEDGNIFSLPWDDYSIYSPALTSDAQEYLQLVERRTQYRIQINIPEDYLTLSGHEEILYTNNEEEPLPEIYLRTFPNLAGGWVTLSGLQAGGAAANFSWEAASSAVKIELEKALQPGEKLLLSMDFSIIIPENMGGNYGLFGYFDEVLVLDLFYPMIPAYDESGWYKDVPASSGDISYNDASFYLVQVNAPKKLVLVASGVEISRAKQDKNQIVTFVQGPARDFYLAGSEDYEKMSEQINEEITVNCYVNNNVLNRQARALDVAATAIEIFGERVGAYDYTEFDVLSTPMLALGIEYPGATGIALGIFDPEATIAGNPSDYYLESTIAHEVAHHWFYNVVGNDQVRHPWLDEAVVQYLTGIYFLDRYGKAAYEEYKSSWEGRWERVDKAPDPVDLAVAEYENGHYGAIVYGRGPLFIEALANEMGEETFFTFLRAYYDSNHWGIGTDEEFESLAEETCQCDLSGLYAEWLSQ